MQASHEPDHKITVLRLTHIDGDALQVLLNRFGLSLKWVSSGSIPGSYWGDEEAGLKGHELWVRPDTPVHSALHEACHFICMDPARRRGLDTNAGGDYDEENAVCYLQILLARCLPAMGSTRMMQDMDAWGYSFRLGSAKAWFERDAEDAQRWLMANGLMSADRQIRFVLRGENTAQDA